MEEGQASNDIFEDVLHENDIFQDDGFTVSATDQVRLNTNVP